jgi:hypothetical protein
MSPNDRDRVVSKCPDASATFFQAVYELGSSLAKESAHWEIHCTCGGGLQTVGSGVTEAAAWANAARRVPR